MTENTISDTADTSPIGTDQASSARPGSGGILLSAGAILGALAASSCCVLPLVFVSLGITGSWMVNLTALEPGGAPVA